MTIRDSSKLANVFRLLDQVLSSKKFKKIEIAYSGGKDSTCLSLLVGEWLLSRGLKDEFEIVLVNSDTLSEIPDMREWTLFFMEEFTRMLEREMVRTGYRVVQPRPVDTFYWRVFIRGYPAPTFNFRWCVNLLKRKPAREITSNDGILVLGHRTDESSSRAKSMKMRLSMCPLTAGRCASYFLSTEGGVEKLYPIADWSEEDVWSYLRSRKDDRVIELDRLFRLYGIVEDNVPVIRARYGCWHCTLVKDQLAHYILGGNYLYLESYRILYRVISDMKVFRTPKEMGYSRYGPLKIHARSLLLNALNSVERASGIRFYGLDEATIQGYSLREIFFKIPEDEANKLIKMAEDNYVNNERVVSDIYALRSSVERKTIEAVIHEVERRLYSNDLLKEMILEIIENIT